MAGLGTYAHREGYNVLYGDWSAKWYGDPEQRIMWWPVNTYNANPQPEISSMHTLQMSTVSRWAEEATPTTFKGDTDEDGATTTIWHIFDAEAGIDLD